ncbi:hypothetical protein [Streptomyces gossypiisoli]|uniref:hypothetical protein n=1 Tax=Streptomyces TaxID=1883 RepID=UPI001487E5A1
MREEGRGLVGLRAQRQAHGFPEPHPAGPDEFADPVIALRLGGCYEGVSLHLYQQPFGRRRDQSRVGVCHGVEGLLAALRPFGCLLESRPGGSCPAHAALPSDAGLTVPAGLARCKPIGLRWVKPIGF